MERVVSSFQVQVARDVVEYRLLSAPSGLVCVRTLRQPDRSSQQLSRAIKSMDALRKMLDADPNADRIKPRASELLAVARQHLDPENHHVSA